MPPPLSDTDPESERVHLGLLRAASPSRRLRLAFSLSRTAMSLARAGLARAFPDASPEEVGLRFVALNYGPELAEEVRSHLGRLPRADRGAWAGAPLVTTPDLFLALAPVLDVLRRLGVRHYVGGSIASSAHGVPRSSIDADVVAELSPAHAAPLVAALREGYYVSDERVCDAISRRASFNVIHLETMVKVDVFVAKDRPFDRRALGRAQLTAAEGAAELPVSSAEDTVLAPLEWYRRGGEASERQWSDVTGLLRVRELDEPYLRQGALELGVADLLDRALEEAGRERRTP